MNEYGEGTSAEAVTIVAATCSLLFGLVAVLTNGILLFTLYKDPYNYFRARSTTYFVASLCISDFLGGLFVQPLYSVYMFSIASKIPQQPKLGDISLIFSHVTTKISIFTVVALSLDRFLAVKLSWKYKTLITVRKVVACDILIWLFSVIFEVSHSAVESGKIFHAIDLHLQTTVPLTIMLALYTATYIEFRRYSRNVVFMQTYTGGRRRVFVRNIRLEKKIVLTVVAIIIVLFISLLPYLIVKYLEDHCHEEDSSKCSELGFVVTRALSVPMLCVSCALNPFLYAWRIPQFRQALRVVQRRACKRFRRQSRATSALNIPTVLASASIVEQNTPAVGHLQQKQDRL